MKNAAGLQQQKLLLRPQSPRDDNAHLQVVLLAMGGYGAGYLGWQIRTSEDTEVSTSICKESAEDINTRKVTCVPGPGRQEATLKEHMSLAPRGRVLLTSSV